MNTVEEVSTELTCSFCNLMKSQVGKLECGHLMCAMCYPYFSRQLDKCYLCVLATAEVKRSTMKFMSSVGSSTNPGERVFCTNPNCLFIGSIEEMVRHRDICKLSAPLPDSEEVFPAEEEASAHVDQIPAHVDQISDPAHEVQNASGNQPSNSCERLPSTKKSSKRSKLRSKSKVPEAKQQKADWTDWQDSEAVSHKHSLETSWEKQTTGAASLASKSINSAFDWDLCDDGVEIYEPNFSYEDIGAPDSNLDEKTHDSHRGVRRRFMFHPDEYDRDTEKRYLFEILVWVLVIAATLAKFVESDENFPKREYDSLNKKVDYYVTWTVPRITETVARAQFNKRDVHLSEFVDVRGYRVKLGVGATLNSFENIVNLWVTAVVVKTDDGVWPADEWMQVRLENPKADLVQSYDFRVEQKGSWKEYTRIQRGKLVYRQMQVESTSRVKYLRFSYLLTYEEGLANNYIVDDQLKVGFKLFRPSGASA